MMTVLLQNKISIQIQIFLRTRTSKISKASVEQVQQHLQQSITLNLCFLVQTLTNHDSSLMKLYIGQLQWLKAKRNSELKTIDVQ